LEWNKNNPILSPLGLFTLAAWLQFSLPTSLPFSFLPFPSESDAGRQKHQRSEMPAMGPMFEEGLVQYLPPTLCVFRDSVPLLLSLYRLVVQWWSGSLLKIFRISGA
jgi:hypothetical protein